MLFIQKEAVYSHGVFWIGADEEEGKAECDRLASIDCDNHHSYALYEFGILNQSEMSNGRDEEYSEYDHDSEHKELYRTKRYKYCVPASDSII